MKSAGRNKQEPSLQDLEDFLAIGRTIRYFRKETAPDMSQEEFSDNAGFSRSQWNRIESGKKPVNFNTLCRVIRALGVSQEEFFGKYLEERMQK